MESSLGVLRACRRKLVHELGIPLEQIPFERLIIVTKVLYQAPCPGTQWGEHEGDCVKEIVVNLFYSGHYCSYAKQRYYEIKS